MFIPAASTLLMANAVSTPYNATIFLPTHKPHTSRWLSPNIASFSFEGDRWPDWAGHHVGEPNEYTNQLMTNLAERTGEMPFIRVANSEDRNRLDLSVETIVGSYPPPTPATPKPESTSNVIGRDYFALSGNFPAGTKFHWGINFQDYNKTETVAQAALLADTFQGSRSDITGHVHLKHVELGNQPDFWGNAYAASIGNLGAAWTPANYSQSLNEFGLAVSEVLALGGEGEPTLSPGGFMSFTRPNFTPLGVLQAGLLDDPAFAALTDQFDEHLYLGGFNPSKTYYTGELMNTNLIRTNVSYQLPGAGYIKDYGLRYVLSETNSYAGHGVPGLSDTLESAIWGVDYMLLAASSGIERCHFHHGVGFAYNSFQPIADAGDRTNLTRPHILPLYNAMLVVSEAAGKTGDAWVTPIQSPTADITVFGVYENKLLSRLVVLNKRLHVDESTERTGYKVKLDNWMGNAKVAGTSAVVKTLIGPTTTSLQGITWGGQSFEGEGGAAEGEEVWRPVEDNAVWVEASSVALIQFR